MKTHLFHSLLLALLLPVSVTAQAPKAPPAPEAQRHYPLSTLRPARLHVGSHALRVWLMDTDGKREEGMMFLLPKDVAADEGMLFLFSNPQPLTFWMKNTRIPLDIAYISADLHIINVVQGRAFDETLLPSRGPAQFVLEVKAGTLQKFGIRAGMPVKVTARKTQEPQVNSRKSR